MSAWRTLALLLVAIASAKAQPHPETGLEFWAIQAKPETNSAVAFASIKKLELLSDQYGHPFETRFTLEVEHVMRGNLTNNVEVYESAERFDALKAKMKFTGDFVFYLQPRTNEIGYLTYWTGFGVRPIDRNSKLTFQRQLRAYDKLPESLDDFGRRQAMLEWGLHCSGHRITAWDGAVAIRNALHPGANFRQQDRTYKLATPSVRLQLDKFFSRMRNEWKGDWQVGSVLMEALSFLAADDMFHHEVRNWATDLRHQPKLWSKTLDKFMTQLKAREIQTDK